MSISYIVAIILSLIILFYASFQLLISRFLGPLKFLVFCGLSFGVIIGYEGLVALFDVFIADIILLFVQIYLLLELINSIRTKKYEVVIELVEDVITEKKAETEQDIINRFKEIDLTKNQVFKGKINFQRV